MQYLDQPTVLTSLRGDIVEIFGLLVDDFEMDS